MDGRCGSKINSVGWALALELLTNAHPCRYAMQMREIEVSKRELGRYAPKKTKTGRSPANAGDLAALHSFFSQKCHAS